jgi:hypothetical protein
MKKRVFFISSSLLWVRESLRVDDKLRSDRVANTSRKTTLNCQESYSDLKHTGLPELEKRQLWPPSLTLNIGVLRLRCAQDDTIKNKDKFKGDFNYPTQANRGLEWGTRQHPHPPPTTGGRVGHPAVVRKLREPSAWE